MFLVMQLSGRTVAELAAAQVDFIAGMVIAVGLPDFVIADYIAVKVCVFALLYVRI